MMNRLKYLFFALGMCVSVLPVHAEQSRPNIVFIFADNLGYGELGSYGGGITRGAPTPRLDALVRVGTRLTNFNVEPLCTPSRSAVMTGRHAIRSGTYSVPGDERADGTLHAADCSANR